MSSTAAKPAVSVVMPTHNPRMDYLRRVLDALRAQTLDQSAWELVVVDNGSREPLKAGMEHTACGQRHEASLPSHLPTFPPSTAHLDIGWHPNARVVREEKLGLTFARLRGFAEAKGELIVMVDDDNVLNPDYLANALKIAEEHKDVGAFGGKCLPEFETQPEPWMEEFLPLLALRDHGEKEIIAGDTRSADGSRRIYPDRAAPIGAGMVVRREAAAAYAEGIKQQAKRIRHTVWEQGRQESVSVGWQPVSPCSAGSIQGRRQRDRKTAERLDQETKRPRDQKPLTDRKGDSLASAGDNDLVFTILRDGWKVGYFPQLTVTHLIPSNRLTVDYLARANRGVQCSWVEVLRKHDACPWPTISSWSLPLRKVKAWALQRPWRQASAKIGLAGLIGRLEGMAQ